MKQEVFNKYTEAVASRFKIEKSDLFTKNKRKDLANARHLLYYLCYKRPMPISYIVKYMNSSGYKVYPSTVTYGITSIIEKISYDRDYQKIVKSIEELI